MVHLVERELYFNFSLIPAMFDLLCVEEGDGATTRGILAGEHDGGRHLGEK